VTKLSKIIAEEIDLQGFLPFWRFMDLALYCPNYGFYEREGDTIGRRGHFYTSVSAGALFGELLAWHWGGVIQKRWTSREPVQIVEAGAHHGALAADLLVGLARHHPGILPRLTYWIVEPSPTRKERQLATLRSIAPVRHASGWDQLRAELGAEGVRGLILSNELLDAMPVRRFGWDRPRRCWREWGVGTEGDRFAWRLLPGELCSTDVGVPEQLAPVLPDGFIHEVSPAAVQWWEAAATVLGEGWLATFDYGHAVSFSPERPNGTLRAYRHHSVSNDVLTDPGEQDITAHVDFPRIQQAGEEAGLKTAIFEPQGRYLSRILCGMIEAGQWRETDPKLAAQLQTLTHPQHLGAAFKALIQERPA
jgi:SAM-dependent MidA family methyltransferase